MVAACRDVVVRSRSGEKDGEHRVDEVEENGTAKSLDQYGRGASLFPNLLDAS